MITPGSFGTTRWARLGVAENHYSRTGPPLITDATQSGELFEYWVHKVYRIPVERRLPFGWMIVNHPRQITARALRSLS